MVEVAHKGLRVVSGAEAKCLELRDRLGKRFAIEDQQMRRITVAGEIPLVHPMCPQRRLADALTFDHIRPIVHAKIVLELVLQNTLHNEKHPWRMRHLSSAEDAVALRDQRLGYSEVADSL